MEQHPLNSVMQTTMEKIKQMIDVNTVIGTPITTEGGTVIIPVSKVSFGFASGGSDFSGKTPATTNFGGGSGAGVTINPIGFLVVDTNGVKMIPIASSNEPVDKIAAMVPEVFDRITNLVSKAKDKKKAEKAEKESVPAADGE